VFEHHSVTFLAVREEENLLSFNPFLQQKFGIINFPIVKKKKDLSYPYALMHSLAATPGRYLEAAYSKIHAKISGGFFLLNPLVDFTESHWWMISQRLDTFSGRIQVFSTSNDVLLGVFFPYMITQEEAFFIRFLSCVSAIIDFSMIKKIYPSADLHVLYNSANFLPQPKTGFYLGEEHLLKLKRMVLHFLNSDLNSNLSSNEFSAVMPYHAGDMLFFAKAFKEVKHNFTRLVFCKEFEDIVRHILPDIKMDLVSVDSPERGKNKDPLNTRHQNNEALYLFEEVMPKIPTEFPYYYFRPIRNYNAAEFHLVDQWKFSLSNQPFLLIDEIIETKKVFSPKEKSIFMHFDAGWHLKIYPEAFQKRLIDLLKKAGYKISVLSDRPNLLEVEQFPFTSLADLENNIRKHAIFLGGDSFPGHFSIHCLEHPTLMLFSSTSYFHSNAKSGYLYWDLQNGLSCCPCGQKNFCSLYKKNDCSNFVPPELVFEKIELLYQTHYGEKM